MSSMTKDLVNYLKCCCVCVDLFPLILCAILTTDILPRDILKKVKSTPGVKLSKDQEKQVTNTTVTLPKPTVGEQNFGKSGDVGRLSADVGTDFG